MAGIASDEYCCNHAPVTNEWRERAAVIGGMKYIDSVFCYNSHGLIDLLNEIRHIDILFLSTEVQQCRDRSVDIPLLESIVKVAWIPRTPGVSTTGSKDRIRRQ